MAALPAPSTASSGKCATSPPQRPRPQWTVNSRARVDGHRLRAGAARSALRLLIERAAARRVFLADFGTARPVDDTSGITTTNMTVSTVAYAAPEQLMGKSIDGRADQYALAASTFHLLTGAQLFPHSSPAVVISRHLDAPVPALAEVRPELASLDPVLAAALAKDPDNRFACCTDFARAFTETVAPQGKRLVAAPTTPAPSARRPHVTPETDGAATQGDAATSVTRWLMGISVAAVLLLLGVIGVLWRPWQHPQSNTTVISSSNASTTSSPTATAAAPPPAPTSVAPETPTSAVAAPPEGYFTDVRRVFSDLNQGQGMPDRPGANRVLGEVFDWVCQHQDTDPPRSQPADSNAGNLVQPPQPPTL